MRHCFLELDGATTGPKLFSGPIGKQLVGVEKTAINSFKNFFSDDLPVLTQSVINDLSEDQKYLYKICHAIQKGSIEAGLTMSSPGTLVHSRFLTTANRVLRLYVSKKAPSAKLRSLANFIVTVYAPMWFKIKTNDSFLMGPKHIFQYIKLVRENVVERNVQKLILNSINRNSYFAHPENILLTMLFDSDENIREIATKTIVDARKTERSERIRAFKKPDLNFECSVYYEMACLDNNEPPFTIKFANTELEGCVEKLSESYLHLLKKIPCHTQAVERNIQLVSKVSKQVSGKRSRNQRICATIQSRSVLPKTNSKKDYASYMEN